LIAFYEKTQIVAVYTPATTIYAHLVAV
jgi:hypothetical protein